MADKATHNTTPTGLRFSHVYLERGPLAPDSQRMRFRLARLIDHFDQFAREPLLSKTVELELGIRSPWSVNNDWPELLPKWQLRDVLDLVTVAFRVLRIHAKSGRHFGRSSASWLQDVNRIFAEEGVSYKVDDAGGVHFVVDEEHARNVAASIAGLQSPRYANVLHSFEDATKALNEAPPNGKQAIRSTFAAAESLFRLILPKAPRLGAKEAEGLNASLDMMYSGDKTARLAATKLLRSFQEWVDAAHFYRHEPGQADSVSQPPLNMAVHMMSVGASHLRWLAEIDSAKQ